MGDLEQFEAARQIEELVKIQAGEKKALATAQSIQEKITQQKIYSNQQLLNKLNSAKLKQLQDSIKAMLANQLTQAQFSSLLKSEFNLMPAQVLSAFKDEYGHSPLQSAILHNDFTKAHELIKSGAPINHEERGCLEISFASRTSVTKNFSPTDINPQAQSRQLPVIKEFGLTLGILAQDKNGVSSQFAHIGPTYSMMNDCISQYANGLSATDDNTKNFKAISEAFTFSDKACQYDFSTASDKAGELLAQRVQQGELTSVPTSCQGHAMAMTIVPNEEGGAYLVFTNRGLGAEPDEFGTHIYNVDDLSKLDASFMQDMVNGHSNGTSHSDIMSKIKEVVNPKEPLQTISQKGQKNDNCTIANPRANLHGVLMCQKAIQANKSVSDMSVQDKASVKESYEGFKKGMRRQKLDDLIEKIKQEPENQDLKTLAREYLNQHPNRSEPGLKNLLNQNQEHRSALVGQAPKPFMVSYEGHDKKSASSFGAEPTKPKKDNTSKPKNR